MVSLVFITALYLSLKEKSGPLSLLALVLSLLGTAAMISGNAALAVWRLAGNYGAARDDAARAVFIAAAEALLARGAHGSPAMFPAFALPTLGNALFSLGMLKSGMYGKGTALAGLIGSGLLLLYVVLVTFVPGTGRFALYAAAPGGIAALVWTLLSSIKLFRYSGDAEKN